MKKQKVEKIATLKTISELPESVSVETPDTTRAVLITYKYVVGYFKDDKKTIPSWGGSMARYPRELGYKLDRMSLMVEVRP